MSLLLADCFGIYDLNDDGYISREEMFQMLKNTMVRQPSEEDPDEGIKDLVETMIKRMVGAMASSVGSFFFQVGCP